MNSIGTNARMTTTGVWTPTKNTTKPRVAAMLYAGATEATPTTMLETSPNAPDLSPLFAPGAGWVAVAAMGPPGSP